MFQKVFEYAGPHKKGLYAATAIVLVSVLMGVLPFVLAYQVIAPLVMGESIEASFIILRVVLVLVCLVLQALFYGWGLNLSHKAAYDTLLRLRTALQKRFEKLPLGVIQDKGTGTVKKLFVDDVDSLEVLLAHSMPEGIANLMIPIAVYVAMFFVDWKLALLSLASIPISLIAMMTMYSVGMKKMGPYYMAGQKMNNTIIEYINGMEVVKVFNKDADSYERFRKDVSDYRDYTLAWYKAAWPWMAIYSSLLPCTIILTLPVGAWFVLSGWSTLPNLILVLCLSLSIGMPLLKSLGFLPTMPQLNYKISALEQVLDAPELQQKLEPKMVQRICDAYELDVTALDETMEVRIVKSGLRDIHVCVKSRDDLLQAVQHEEEISRISEELDVVGVHMSCLNLPKTEQITAYCSNYAPLYDIPEECATGTSNGGLTYYLYQKGMIQVNQMNCFLQGEHMHRPSKVYTKVRMADGKPTIWVGGCGVICREGIHLNI